MPLAAIQSGHVDYVLTPAQIGPKIQQLIEEARRAFAEPDAPDSTTPLTDLLRLLALRSGTDFSSYKHSTLMRRVQHQQMLLKLADLSSYLQYVRQHPQALDALFHDLLIGVTGFFRDPDVFAGLSTWLADLLQRKAENKPLRIWVPGCASGEEAYSLAIMLHQLLQTLQLTTPVLIFATDLDERALAHARSGVFSPEVLKSLPVELLESCFSPSDAGYVLNRALRSMVMFSTHDLTAHPPFHKLDLISCRNLLIYFDQDLQKSILAMFHAALNPAGLLLLGKSESVGASQSLFESVDSELKIYRRQPQIWAPFLRAPRQTRLSAQEFSQKPSQANWLDARKEVLAQVFDHPSLLLGTELEIQQIYGDVTPFLQMGQALTSNQLIEICLPEHQLELRSLIVQARHDGLPRSGAFRRLSALQDLLRIHVHPRIWPESGHLLVVFEGLELPPGFETPLSQQPDDNPQIAHLKQELSDREARMNVLLEQLDLARVQQQVLNEELQSANEEMQTINEELQSSNQELNVNNEELATANEELQASNFEIQQAFKNLHTLHVELEHKENLLQISSAHLSTLLESTAQSFVLLDKDYHVLSFNQQAVSLHSELYGQALAEGMVLYDSLSDAVLPVLLPLLKQAAQSGQALQHELMIEHDGRQVWLRYELIPVLDAHQELISLALSCLDISVQKTASLAIERSNLLIDAIFNATGAGLCLIDEAGYFVKANPGCTEIFGYSQQEILSRHITDMVSPESHEAVMQSHLAFNQKGYQAPREWRLMRKDGRFIDVSITGHLFMHPDGSRYRVSTLQDITAHKKDRLLLSDTLQMTGIGGWEWDLSSGELSWTPEVYGIYGQDPAKPIDLDKALAAYLPASRIKLEQALERARTLGEPYDLELELQRSNGERVWVRTTCRASGHAGQILRLHGTFQDISQHHLAEANLHKLSLVAQQLPNMVAITNADFQIEFVNQAYLQATGYDFESLRGQSPLLLHGEATDVITQTRIVKSLVHKQQVREEILFYNRQGQPFWCELLITPVAASQDQPACYIVLQTNISQRKRREELLLFQSNILAHVNDSIVVSDLEGKISYWNKGAERTYGYRMQEMLGKPISVLDPDFDTQQFLDLYQRGENPTRHNLETLRRHQNGSQIWISYRLDVIYSAERMPLGIVRVSRDVTEKRQIESALRDSEKTFRALSEKSADGIMVVSVDGFASYISASTERLLGYPADLLKATPVLNLVHPDDKTLVAVLLHDLADHPGKSAIIECRLRHAHERWIWFESTSTNMLHDPYLKGIVCNFRDITQRKASEHSLQQHEQLYRSIAENFPRGMVMVLDQQLHCIFVDGQENNPLVRRPQGQIYLDGFPMPAGKLLQQHLSQALLGHQQGFELNLEDDWYTFSIVPLSEKSNEATQDKPLRVSRLLVVVQNITEDKQGLEDKNRLIQELTSKNEDLNQFTYIISHNLRAPIANLKGLLHLMDLEHLIPTTGLDIFGNFSLTVNKLDDTILDLNRILNIRRHRDEISQDIDLDAELARALENLAVMAPDILSWVQTELGIGHFVSVKSYIQSILYNLISNAIKYRHPQRQPWIQVSSGRSNESLWIAVQDNGLGLDLASVQSKLFRLYMRFHPHIDGKGMGLYLIKTQAEALGGGVEVSSELGLGTRFLVYFKESTQTDQSEAPLRPL